MTRIELKIGCALLGLAMATPALSQDLQSRPAAPPPEAAAPPQAGDQIKFSADVLTYDDKAAIVTATGDVRAYRADQRLRADKVDWNRTTGKVVASGNVAVTNADGDTAYGDRIDLSDSLKDGVVENMLVVLAQGGRIAAREGQREADGTLTLSHAAYTPCAVETSDGCPKEPTWRITAVRVTYHPERERIYYVGARLNLFGLPSLPLPKLSSPVGNQPQTGLLAPLIRLSGINGLEIGTPYYIALAPNRGLTITPHLFTAVLPMIEAKYDLLSQKGAFRLTGYLTDSRRSDDLVSTENTPSEHAVRGYIDGVGRYQFTPELSVSGSLRLATDPTFLRRYDISRDDRLRTTLALEHIDANSYFVLDGWYIQTQRVDDRQGLQPFALPELDYRRRFGEGLLGGTITAEVNTLAIERSAGQDTQRAFASVEWDLRKLTRWGQEVTFTALARGDAYHTSDILSSPVVYQGMPGFHTRAIGALAMDIQWPFVGTLGGGTQRFVPRFQLVATPGVDNFSIPNEDARAVDLDDSNLFSLNRFPGYDRWEDSSRATYGLQWNADLPGLRIESEVGQSYRLSDRPTILFPGTGLSDRFSDLVGRTEVRYKDFVSLIARYRLDHDNFTVRRNEVDATVGSQGTYLLVGYLRLNRDISSVEDLRDSEEIRLAGRWQFSRFWSAFGSTVIDLTNKDEDPLSLADGFDPISHRVGFQYEDDCLRLGLTWRRYYQDTGDARRGNSFLLTLAFTNLGR